MDVIIHKELRDELVEHYLKVFSTILDKTCIGGVDETIEKVKNEVQRCNVLQVWFVMFLVVYKLQLFSVTEEEDTETLNYEEKWLKTVMGELL